VRVRDKNRAELKSGPRQGRKKEDTERFQQQTSGGTKSPLPPSCTFSKLISIPPLADFGEDRKEKEIEGKKGRLSPLLQSWNRLKLLMQSRKCYSAITAFSSPFQSSSSILPTYYIYIRKQKKSARGESKLGNWQT